MAVGLGESQSEGEKRNYEKNVLHLFSKRRGNIPFILKNYKSIEKDWKEKHKSINLKILGYKILGKSRTCWYMASSVFIL